MCRRWKKRGVKGYKMTYWFAAYVPSGTPADGVARLNDILVKAAYSSGAAGFYQSTGTEIFTNTPVALGKFQTAESLKRGPHHRGGGRHARITRRPSGSGRTMVLFLVLLIK